MVPVAPDEPEKQSGFGLSSSYRVNSAPRSSCVAKPDSVDSSTRLLWRETIRSHPESVRAALVRLTGRLAAQGLSTDENEDAEIALTEALNNVVEHASSGQPDETMTLEVGLADFFLTFRLEDDGMPLPDLSLPQVQDHDLNVGLQELPEGGFGWLLIQKLACNIYYCRRGDRNFFTFRIETGMLR